MKAINKIKSYVRTDGLLHIETSAVVLLVLRQVIKVIGGPCPLAFAAVLTFLVGVYKECYDGISKKGSVEMHDIVCDIIGIVLAILCLI